MADQGTIDRQSGIQDHFAGLWATTANVFRPVGRMMGHAVKAMQYSRMVAVLMDRSDAQLAAIGITREDIPRHAAYLVDYEYDGL